LEEPVPTIGSAQFIEEITRIQRLLYGFIYSMVRDSAATDDVLQETNLVLWKKSGDFRPGTNFAGWAFQIAHWQVLAHRKRQQRSREHFDDDLLTQLADDALSRLDRIERRHLALRECLKRLRPEQQTLVSRRYEPGGSVNQIAQQSGRSPKAVSEALRRIRSILMNCIEQTLSLEGA
jgi:RNA polymerase sigma-70 factor (ECF subfamily)